MFLCESIPLKNGFGTFFHLFIVFFGRVDSFFRFHQISSGFTKCLYFWENQLFSQLASITRTTCRHFSFSRSNLYSFPGHGKTNEKTSPCKRVAKQIVTCVGSYRAGPKTAPGGSLPPASWRRFWAHHIALNAHHYQTNL